MKALLGLDGAEGAYAAVELAARMLAGEQDELVLYYSLPPITPSWHRQVSPEVMDRARTALSTAVFKGAIDRLPPRLVDRTKTIAGCHAPGLGIMTAADECRADLIVVGARGAEAESTHALGSVARQVVHDASVPILVVRPRRDHDAQRPLRVLFATDGTDCSQQAAAALKKFTWPENTVVRLMTVIEHPWGGQIPSWLEAEMQNYDLKAMGFGSFEEDEAEKTRVREHLRQLCGSLPPIFHREEPIVAVGYPSRKILATLAEQRFDLAIVGARRMSPIGRWFLGSVSERLLNSAPCSVLLVRQHEKA
jgi:nucleotide-binding universal stress UspA family protein